MQIIQSIRDKGAAVVITVIALSLIGFILMDAKQGSGNLSSSTSKSIGSVNGSSIDQGEFTKKVKQLEDQEAQRSGINPTGARAAQIREQVWNQMVAEKVFYAEAAKLGIDFTPKEFTSFLYSNEQSNPLLQDPQMVDPATGKLDANKVQAAIANFKKLKPEQLEMLDAQVKDPQKLNSISSKYYSLLAASAYVPTWMEQKNNTDANNFANISYVAIPYNTISDSTIKISDADVDKYVSNNKELFKQEAGRTISYVTFSQLPSATDSAKTRDIVAALKESFTADVNPTAFTARQASTIPYDSNYLPKSKIPSAYIDTIVKFAQGTVYGPYVDRGNYVMAKVLGSKFYPDSVKARHILIPTVDPQSDQPIAIDSVAKKQADSIFNAIKAGADFGALAKQFSSDGSKDKGGDLEIFGYGEMVPEFNEFCFTKSVGSKEVVKTKFGYHVIEILSQKGSSPAYKVAFMAKEIIASEGTINNASLEATKLSAEKNSKNVDEYVKKNGLQKTNPDKLLKENDFSVGQLQDARLIVKWAFKAKVGEVSEPFSLGDQFAVAVLDKIQKEGTQDVATARPTVENVLRNEIKANEIVKKLGATPTLEKAAADYGKQVQTAGQDSTITFNSQMINGLGQEQKLIGAIFNPTNKTKASEPIVGKTGVYLVKVNGIAPKNAPSAEILAMQKTQEINNVKNKATAGWFESLKKRATIKDNRSEIY
jgi:peptidyl-prolyl cis-trans isomerase D